MLAICFRIELSAQEIEFFNLVIFYIGRPKMKEICSNFLNRLRDELVIQEIRLHYIIFILKNSNFGRWVFNITYSRNFSINWVLCPALEYSTSLPSSLKNSKLQELRKFMSKKCLGQVRKIIKNSVIQKLNRYNFLFP